MMNFENTLAFAQQLDAADELKNFRDQFYFPQHNGQNVLYYTGNSLGLQPKQTQQYIQQELNDWAQHGVEGHFEAKNPWFSYHEQLSKPLAMLTGAKESEVVAMNQLTSNIHFLFVSFYRPTAKRYKIICEAKAFPSDQYLIETQIQHHGFKPEEAIIEVSPRAGEHYIRQEDIINTIQQHGESVELVFIGGVNYLSGQVFDMAAITQAAHEFGAYAGFDLAHAIGNIKLELHKWNVDFAAWCSYKYLNSGPGSVGGAFVHEKHHNSNLPRLAGWWGHDKASRFKMEKGFKPINSAEGWQLSNAPVLSMAAHKAALALFEEAGLEKLLVKSRKLTNYLEFIINDVNAVWKQKNENLKLEIVTQQTGDIQRGCQLSIIAHGMGKELHTQLTKHGVIADWREPNVIRFAPVPLYNSFEDVFKLGEILKAII